MSESLRVSPWDDLIRNSAPLQRDVLIAFLLMDGEDDDEHLARRHGCTVQEVRRERRLVRRRLESRGGEV